MTLQTGLHGGGAPLAPDTSPLGNAVWSALTGPHAHLAERSETGVPPAEGWGRLRLPGWTEISAVRTDPALPHARLRSRGGTPMGRGLATRLIRAVAAGIRERGDTPFLHAAPGNANAIRLYESIGFTERLRGRTRLVRSPGTTTNAGLL
ncbi:GNAT family N-acetyltransferase [Streptomyces sp. NPDC001833]|uniref:GNAT family N-acetyltransferase n=1 Tax=Streptomyces sp. NPDC001833 TaxID=3154658 RepID=UPI0033325C73